MAIEKPPAGTRGARTPPRIFGLVILPVMTWIHRRSHDRINGVDLLYLTTVGARTGRERTVPVARFDDGKGGWVVVAAYAGSISHPGWYHNLAARPDQVWAEVRGTRHRVTVEQLAGADRDAAWAVVVAAAPNFAGYGSRTDRQLPVLRLTPVDPA